VKGGGWNRKEYTGTEVHGKTLGMIGLGKVGYEVARRMQEFGMDVKTYDPYASKKHADQLEVELLELEERISEVDVLTVHNQLTEQTKDLISFENADKFRKGMFLINCARGGIYKEEDLADLIDEGYVAGIALDVYSEEPPTGELVEELQHPNIICT